MTSEQVEGLFYIIVLVVLVFAIARLRASMANIEKQAYRNQEKPSELKERIGAIKGHSADRYIDLKFIDESGSKNIIASKKLDDGSLILTISDQQD